MGEKPEIEDTSPQKAIELHSDANTPGEVEGDGTFYGHNKKHGLEMEGSPGRDSSRAEAPGTLGGVEVEGSRGGIEMEGSRVPEMNGGQPEVFELPAGDYLTAGTGRERRGRRSPGASRSQANSYNSADARSPASPQSPASGSNLGSQRDRERPRERNVRGDRGRAVEDNSRWSWRRSRADGEPF